MLARVVTTEWGVHVLRGGGWWIVIVGMMVGVTWVCGVRAVCALMGAGRLSWT